MRSNLGDEFIKVHRGCLVSVKAIHEIADKIVLCNGEYLEYTIRKRKLIIEQFCLKQKNIFTNISHEGCPDTWEEYQSYYRAYENLPFAFTDIEMVFDEKKTGCRLDIQVWKSSACATGKIIIGCTYWKIF